MRPDSSFSVIILAGQRSGRIDPLASAAGLTHKCLVPIAGVPLICHVVEAVSSLPDVARIRVCIEQEMFGPAAAALGNLAGGRLDFVAAANNLADSIHTACEPLGGRIIITTADNVLLMPCSIQTMLTAMDRGAEAAVAFAPKHAVLASHPDGQRRFYRFADGEYSNCNLYALAGLGGRAAVELFRSGGQFAKHPLRIAWTFGVMNLLLVRLGLLTLPGALARISRRIGIRLDPVVLTDGSQAIDVDNERTFKVAEQLLAARVRPYEPALAAEA